MGTIVERRRKTGATAYLAKISITRAGVTHRENKTFDRRPAASAWIARREGELRQPGAIEAAGPAGATLGDIIDRYNKESARTPGRSKAQALRTLRDQEIAERPCSEITSQDIVALARTLQEGRKPQTVAGYLSHLATVIRLARPAWGYPIDRRVMDDAFAAARNLGLVEKADERTRRPTMDELDRLMTHFEERHERSRWSLPMHKIIPFAIFSARRQEEITLLRWDDVDWANKRVLVRDMKDPRRKAGNNIWCELSPEAMAIMRSMLKRDEQIFPYHPTVVSRAFTKACQALDIEDLHFHDLRHDGVSRLFEMGKTIPQVAAMSAHKSWANLRRYTHLSQAGDKYAGWKWFDLVNRPMPIPVHMRPRAPGYGGPSPGE
ncbi:MAG TPA: site-specific integrase [Bosea sp. (in: a-proteobacteria)]